MGAIISGIMGVLTSIFGAMVAKLTAKIGINAAVIAVWVAASAAFAIALTSMGSVLMVSMPAPVADFFSVAPSNTGTCLGVIMASEAAAHVYRQTVIIASVKSRV